MNRNSILPGLLLIAIGLIFFINNWLHIGIDRLWPLIFLLLTILMFRVYLSNRQQNAEVLIPMAIFFVLWLIFQYSALYGWYHMSWLWPGFIAGPGLGFLLVYFHKHEPGWLVPAVILLGISGIFFLELSHYARYWPVLLIIGGLLLILLPGRTRKNAGADS